MTDRKLISRDEVLAGLGGRSNKQAATVLALIQQRTAYFVAHLQQVANAALAVAATQTPPQSYLAAIAEGREKQPPPTIQAIERYTQHWAMLVPNNPTIRAIVAYLLGQQYNFTAAAIPGIRTALGLDQEVVQQAYQQLYKQPLATIYSPQLHLLDRLRWGWAAFSALLEALPPFWLTFFLTMPAASGLLAVPIALASVGPLWGVTIIVCFGLINLLTAAALAETVVRSGVARFGLGFLGQLAQEYLGASASTLVTIVLAASNFPVLIIFFLGVGSTLSGATGLPATLWMGLLLVVILYFLAQRTLNATVTTTLLIVFTNLLIVGAILLLALPYFQWGNLTSSVDASAFTPAALGSIVGVLSATFLSHFLLATYGPAVLPRDPGGRAWLRGSIAAMLVMILIASLWLVVISGVVAPQVLRTATGTVVTPLAAIVGPAVNLLGALLVILSIGLATIQVGLAQYYSLEERLPVRGAVSWIGQLSERQRFWVAVSPMFLVLGFAVWLVASGIGSFASLLGTVNALALPLLTGILPLLLLVATRHKGDFVPSSFFHWLGHPVVVGLLYFFFIAIILIHGGYIWSAWPLRLFALGGGLVILLVTWNIWRRGLTASRLVIEVRQDEQVAGQSRFSSVANGQPVIALVNLHYRGRQQAYQSATGAIADFAGLQRVTLQATTQAATQLKVWVHRLTVEGASVGLPAQVQIENDQHKQDKFATNATSGQFYVPLNGSVCQVTISLLDEGKE